MDHPGKLSLVDRAIGFAARAHAGQQRKTGHKVPFIAHPFGVAMILRDMGCDEAVIAAGLLHDTIEDTAVTVEELRSVFGDEVAEIVSGVTEPPKKKMKWEKRKLHMIRLLYDAPLNVKLVAAADKYHNLSHTLSTKQSVGSDVWKSFGRGEEQQAWYYRAVLDSILANVEEPQNYPLLEQLAAVIEELFRGVPSYPPAEHKEKATAR